MKWSKRTPSRENPVQDCIIKRYEADAWHTVNVGHNHSYLRVLWHSRPNCSSWNPRASDKQRTSIWWALRCTVYLKVFVVKKFVEGCSTWSRKAPFGEGSFSARHVLSNSNLANSCRVFLCRRCLPFWCIFLFGLFQFLLNSWSKFLC